MATIAPAASQGIYRVGRWRYRLGWIAYLAVLRAEFCGPGCGLVESFLVVEC
jgi:hypothetical protein